MSKSFDIAVVGAGGPVGELILELLAEREFPVGVLYLLGADEFVGKTIQFNGKNHKIKAVEDFDFSKTSIALFNASADVADRYAAVASQAGCVVVDNSTAFIGNQDIPLVVAELNPQAISGYAKTGIVSSLASLAGQIALVLNKIHQRADITHINIATYQAVGGFDKRGIEELAGQTANLLNMRPVEKHRFSKQIAFNTLPLIGDLLDNGYSTEEMALIEELPQLLGESINVSATAVQVPVFFGDSAVVHIKTRNDISVDDARKLLAANEGVELVEGAETGEFPTAVDDAAGNDKVLVGRIRKDLAAENGLNLWLVVDKVRKGAALNSIQIAEILVKDYL
ncbi:MAG: aspartate-semialdehyde dehydrogenase [Gammaproteobacteria bacterium]|nr:aspartate-semialdehyde dehydrogenase [Gammaproteobacteria bacterium]